MPQRRRTRLAREERGPKCTNSAIRHKFLGRARGSVTALPLKFSTWSQFSLYSRPVLRQSAQSAVTCHWSSVFLIWTLSPSASSNLASSHLSDGSQILDDATRRRVQVSIDCKTALGEGTRPGPLLCALQLLRSERSLCIVHVPRPHEASGLALPQDDDRELTRAVDKGW